MYLFRKAARNSIETEVNHQRYRTDTFAFPVPDGIQNQECVIGLHRNFTITRQSNTVFPEEQVDEIETGIKTRAC